jgi:glucose/arabinose dehydrogenase/PKD repeat protein
MVRAGALVLVVLGLLAPASARASVFSAPRAPDIAGTTLPDGFVETTPWSIPDYATAVRFAPDGHVFVAGKSGVVYEFDGPDDRTPTVFADLSKEVFNGWDRGLLGLAIDPQYSSGRPYIYVAYTYDKEAGDPDMPRWSDSCPDVDAGCPVSGRISRLGPDGTETVLVEDFCDQSLSHSMGALQFGPDGALYAGAGDGASYSSVDYGQTGDPGNPCGDPPGPRGTALAPPAAEGGALRAQSFRRPANEPATLNGAILRIDPDTGAARADNPAAGNADPQRRRIVAYGFRNPFRFTFRPGTPELWVGDVGFNSWEEIDRVPDASQVRNYGWPCYEGDERQAGYEAVGLDACTSLYSDASALPPFFAYDHDKPLGDACPAGSSSISGMAFYDGAAFPAAYRGALFFADYSRGCIWAMLPGADGTPDPATLQVFASGAGGPVDLEVGPDGDLYYADVFDGQIRRIAPVGGAPTAKIDASPDADGTPLTVHLDGSGSSAGVTYAWDLDGDGRYDDSTAARPSVTYTGEGYVTVGLRVTDASGSSGETTRRITVGTPPTPTIAAPTAARTWAVGDTVGFSGAAVDGHGAALPAADLHWTLDMRHCARTDPSSCHTHRIADYAGVASGSFVAPDHEYPSHLELTLTATDAHCLSSTQTLPLMPETATVSVDSTPEGARIGFGSDQETTPFTETVIKGSQTTLSAASPQSIDKSSYVFGAWDDGGAGTRTVAPGSYHVRFDSVADERLAGTEAVGDHVSTALPGRAETYRLPEPTTSGTVMALRLRLDEASEASKLVLGLYSEGDDTAGVLLGSGTLENPAAGAWNEVRLDAPVEVEAGRRYWLALLNPLDSAGPLSWRDQAEQPADWERTSDSLALTALPGNWLTGLSYADGGPVSGGAYGVPDASPAPVAARAARAAAADEDEDEVAAPAAPAGCAPTVAVAAPPPAATPTPTPTASPAPTATPTPPPVTQPAPKPRPLPHLRIPARLRATHGAVRLRLSCPVSCAFTATISAGGHTLGRAAKTGRTVTLRVALNAHGRRLVAAGHRVTVRLTRRAAGRTQTAKRTLRLRR